MAVNPKTVHHCCSKSSPIKPPHSFVSQINKNLYIRLHSSEGATTLQQPSISYKLNGLVNLLNFVDSLIQLTCTQQSVLKEQNYSILMESLLDESLWLIDACGMIRDVLMQTIDETQQLQSVLRRKSDDIDEVVKQCGSYFKSRKRFKKVITKLLKKADSFRNKVVNLDSCNENQKTVISYLCVVERSHSISVDVLKSLISYIAPCSRTPNKWSLVSKLVHCSRQQQEDCCCLKKTQFEVVDDALHMLACQKKVACMNILQIEYVRRHLQDLESVAVDFERSIECLSRLLIKSRVVLLNILNQ